MFTLAVEVAETGIRQQERSFPAALEERAAAELVVDLQAMRQQVA